MGSGAGLIVGIPFVVLTLALLAIFRRDRRQREAGGDPIRWLPLYRLVALALILFVGYLLIVPIIALIDPGLLPPGMRPPN